jgi:hypothetical protein
VPCGIAGVEMTSVQNEKGAGSGEQWWRESMTAVIKTFGETFGVDVISCPEGPARLRHASLRTLVVAEPGLQPTDPSSPFDA